jgi:glycerophosphoryl diester phosphodiesterase
MDQSQARNVVRERSIAFVAHRGNVPGYPENTAAAFGQAVKLGADFLEMDLRGTKDGQIVILHDATLDRTTNGRGQVADFTLEELQRLDAGHHEQIPTFEEVLRLFSGTRVKLLLHIKEGPGLDKPQVVHLIEKFDVVFDVIVGPRSLDDLKSFKALNPNLRTLGFIPELEDIAAFVAAGIDVIRLWPKWIVADPELVGKCHALGRPVWATVNDASRPAIEALIGYGVDGILADLPNVMCLIIQDLKRARGF